MEKKTKHRKVSRLSSSRTTNRVVPISEIFYSIEGEGILTGFPTVFVRTFGCNFTCSGFGERTETTEALGVSLIPITKLDEFVPYKSGCDSIYAWSPFYRELSKKYTEDELIEGMLQTLPHETKEWKVGRTKPVLSLTGGEPTLHQKFWEQFMSNKFLNQVDKILIETNCAVPLSDNFLNALRAWQRRSGGMVMWANSPKLSVSGEPWDKAIRPEILVSQYSVSDMAYLKFVSDGSPESVEEVLKAVREYNKGLKTINKEIREDQVLLMPMGATEDQQKEIQKRVARACLDTGFIYCARQHIQIWANAVGT